LPKLIEFRHEIDGFKRDCAKFRDLCAQCIWQNVIPYVPEIYKTKPVNMDTSHLMHVFSISDEFKECMDPRFNVTYGRETYPHPMFDNMRDNNYLAFIVDNYENFAEFVIFVHGHNVSRAHQSTPLNDILDSTWEKIQRFNWTKCPEGTYFSYHYYDWVRQNTTKCNHFPNPVTGTPRFSCAYLEFFHHEMPLTQFGCLCHPCHGQFVVTRERIRSRPRSFWEYALVYGRTCMSEKGYQHPDLEPARKCSPNVLEWVWHVILGEPYDLRNQSSALIDNCLD